MSASRSAQTTVFGGTLFLSATLLFVAQPMIGKMLLPTCGGAPAVWITCMLFFQAILLAGYAYAHGMARWLGPPRHAVVHLALLLAPMLLLPLPLVSSASAPVQSNPTLWLLGHLIVLAGAPLFVVSSTAPLLQRWFAETRHPSASDPYFLYAASNAGSLAGLLGYPLAIEPRLTLLEQGRWWALGYGMLVAAMLGCALFVWRRGPAPSIGTPSDAGDAIERVPARARLRWVLLALVPSSFLLGVTTHITTNIAAVPLLWIIPLALYLATFVLAFARRQVVPHTWVVHAFPYIVLPLVPLTLFDSPDLSWPVIPLHLLLFLTVALLCHGELARSRPQPRHLTEFYLWIAVGGALGGVANAVLAPLVFDSIVEYPLMAVACCFLLPGRGVVAGSRRERWLDLVYPAVLAALLGATALALARGWHAPPRTVTGALIGIGAMGSFLLRDRPLRFGLGLGVFVLLLARLGGPDDGRSLLRERNFYGVKRVVDDADGRFRRLIHGTTNHGMQWLDPARRGEPAAYYDRSGPVGDVFHGLAQAGQPGEAAIIGLGVGGLATYAEPGMHFTFFEIDPAVIEIARDATYFTFLADCGDRCDVVAGDGRLTLTGEPDARFDLIVLDAFTSDAVPTHLLTREALELYLAKLDEHGLLVFNITNAYLEFDGVMGNLARAIGLAARHRDDAGIDPALEARGKLSSHYVVMAREEQDLGPLANSPLWRPLPADPRARVWSDQFCNVLGLLRRARSQ